VNAKKKQPIGYTPTNIRLRNDLRSKAQEFAERTNRNLSQMLATLLEEAILARNGKAK
jgi:predicted transcriptional regulator